MELSAGHNITVDVFHGSSSLAAYSTTRGKNVPCSSHPWRSANHGTDDDNLPFHTSIT